MKTPSEVKLDGTANELITTGFITLTRSKQKVNKRRI
jgi:hypothetical protein